MAVSISKEERNEALRLEALKISIALYGGKGAISSKFLSFAAEVYEFIKKDSAPAEEETAKSAE